METFFHRNGHVPHSWRPEHIHLMILSAKLYKKEFHVIRSSYCCNRLRFSYSVRFTVRKVYKKSFFQCDDCIIPVRFIAKERGKKMWDMTKKKIECESTMKSSTHAERHSRLNCVPESVSV